MAPERDRRSSPRRANGLIALSSAAVIAVYTAGYVRTRPAAERIAAQSAQRRSPGPAAMVVARSEATAIPPVHSQVTAAESSGPQPPASSPGMPAFPRTAESSAVEGLTPSAAPEVAPAETPERIHDDGPPSPDAAVTTAQPEEYRDGTYLGWGSCRHGDIQAEVLIENGRIASATIAQCLTRYSCSWISALPGQVVSRQSTNVDYVSGATQSTDAFSDAVADALSKAK